MAIQDGKITVKIGNMLFSWIPPSIPRYFHLADDPKEHLKQGRGIFFQLLPRIA